MTRARLRRCRSWNDPLGSRTAEPDYDHRGGRRVGYARVVEDDARSVAALAARELRLPAPRAVASCRSAASSTLCATLAPRTTSGARRNLGRVCRQARAVSAERPDAPRSPMRRTGAEAAALLLELGARLPRQRRSRSPAVPEDGGEVPEPWRRLANGASLVLAGSQIGAAHETRSVAASAMRACRRCVQLRRSASAAR